MDSHNIRTLLEMVRSDPVDIVVVKPAPVGKIGDTAVVCAGTLDLPGGRRSGGDAKSAGKQDSGVFTMSAFQPASATAKCLFFRPIVMPVSGLSSTSFFSAPPAALCCF